MRGSNTPKFYFSVIASEAKQSREGYAALDCFATLAMTNCVNCSSINTMAAVRPHTCAPRRRHNLALDRMAGHVPPPRSIKPDNFSHDKRDAMKRVYKPLKLGRFWSRVEGKSAPLQRRLEPIASFDFVSVRLLSTT
jgi:hypothetical protein